MFGKVCRFSTDRLLVGEWHSLDCDAWKQLDLAVVVRDMLTERVTHTLPTAWQGTYTLDRARAWIEERDDEGMTLLAVEKVSRRPIGLIILFESGSSTARTDLRLGYLLAESAWGKGLASELIGGFVAWCGSNGVGSLAGGVEPENIASRRVLEKCGFVLDATSESSEEQIFVLSLH
ncbi:MAG: GNAT family N-acetyltransferase [Candidatus Latescibacteria bacterium]|nr:GNAT family N-acetyltransferase [Candidatus Latescibacterota bacterium]